MTILTDIQRHIKQSNALDKLLYANLFFFIISVLFPEFVTKWLALPASFSEVLLKPWTLFSYAFIHHRLLHILSNLIVLYFIGNLFLNFFSSKKLILYYFLGLFFGGIMFIGYYSFSKSLSTYSLIGASAAVTAILIGLATKIPHYAIRLRFIGSVELWILAAIWIVLSAFTAAGINAGSGMAHLGGALIGFLLTSYFKEGQVLLSLLSFTSKKRKAPFTNIYKNKVKTTDSYRQKKQNEELINSILEKISKSGYDSLTKQEKEFLFNQKEK